MNKTPTCHELSRVQEDLLARRGVPGAGQAMRFRPRQSVGRRWQATARAIVSHGSGRQRMEGDLRGAVIPHGAPHSGAIALLPGPMQTMISTPDFRGRFFFRGRAAERGRRVCHSERSEGSAVWSKKCRSLASLGMTREAARDDNESRSGWQGKPLGM